MTDPTEPPRGRSLIAELSHRHVWRAAVLYVGAVWALAQGIAQLGPSVGAPDWVVRWFLVAAAIGFPFWIAFAWFFAWTPEGFRREETVERNPVLARATGRKLDFWIIGVLVVAVVLLLTNTFVLHRDATSVDNASSADAIAAELTKVPAKSVAVLPFASADPKQQYFSDGMAEELISDLTQIDGLKVIGKYSSFKFRDAKDSPAQIGAALGVANLIEGSVRQQGSRIRIVVGMISAKDGTSMWSQSYDQPLQDVFAIQAEIGKAVTTALRVKLLGKSIVDETRPPSGNVEAYQLMLQGRALARKSTKADYEHGIALLEKAVRIDPGYAYAWAILSNYRINLGLGYLSGEERQRIYAKARTSLDRAAALAPNSPTTLQDRGYMLSTLDFDQAAALAVTQRAVELAPNDGVTRSFLATQLGTMGKLQAAVDLYREAITTDPLRVDWYCNLANALAVLGHLDASESAIRKVLELQPSYPGAYSQLVTVDILRNNPAAALRDAAKETDPVSRAAALAVAQQITGNRRTADAALQAYIAEHGKAWPYLVAELYAVRQQPDDMLEWLDRAVAIQKGVVVNNLLNDPLLARYKTDPRFAALCHEIGLPAPGEPLPVVASTPSGAASAP